MNDSKKMERLTFVIMALLFVVFALGLAGKGDLQEAQDQAKVYNEMVCAGHWPDYENRKPTCE